MIFTLLQLRLDLIIQSNLSNMSPSKISKRALNTLVRLPRESKPGSIRRAAVNQNRGPRLLFPSRK
jgi:hypothetical protein